MTNDCHDVGAARVRATFFADADDAARGNGSCRLYQKPPLPVNK